MNPATGTVIAVLLSLVSAGGYAFAAVAQSRLAAASPVQDGRGALRALLARGQWWSAVGLNAAGALAHVAALHYGPLTLVQPLGALTLVAALPLGAYAARRRVTRTEWRGALWTLAGLVGLVAVTGPTEPGEALSLRESLVVAAATALLIVALASGRHPAKGHAPRGLGHATASGIASGVASALTQTLTAAFALELPGGTPAWWQTALLAVLISGFATGGLLLSQAAYRGGLAAPLAVVNLSNPAAAAIIGVALLGETFRAGAWGWLVAAGASLVAARGVVLLTKGDSPEAAPAAHPEVVAVSIPEAVAMPAPETVAVSVPEAMAMPAPETVVVPMPETVVVPMPEAVATPAPEVVAVSAPEAVALPDPITPRRPTTPPDPTTPSGPRNPGSTRMRTPARWTILRSVPTPRSAHDLSARRSARPDPATPMPTTPLPTAPQLDLPDLAGPGAEPAHAPAAG
ncbi:DMT family transporter [Streptomyces sp. NPDC056525]|uniref:DMT family transporter n=1 Tax=unclassified Streptomyces TaxID=2593676 RepID=UPI0036B2191D